MQIFLSAGYTHANVLQGCTGGLCSACCLLESRRPLFQSKYAVIQAPSLCVYCDPSMSGGFDTFSFVFRKFLMTHSLLAQISLDNMALLGEKKSTDLVYLIYEKPTTEIAHNTCSNDKQLKDD